MLIEPEAPFLGAIDIDMERGRLGRDRQQPDTSVDLVDLIERQLGQARPIEGVVRTGGLRRRPPRPARRARLGQLVAAALHEAAAEVAQAAQQQRRRDLHRHRNR